MASKKIKLMITAIDELSKRIEKATTVEVVDQQEDVQLAELQTRLDSMAEKLKAVETEKAKLLAEQTELNKPDENEDKLKNIMLELMK